MTDTDLEQRYPVIVTDTRTHVVWVDGYDADDALRNAQAQDWYDLLEGRSGSESLAWCSLNADLPAARDLQKYGLVASEGDNYPGTAYDAHVKEWERREREAKKTACRAAGIHPNRTTWPSGLTTCKDCHIHLEPIGASS